MEIEIPNRQIKDIIKNTSPDNKFDFLVHYKEGPDAELFNGLMMAAFMFRKEKLPQFGQVLKMFGEAIAEAEKTNGDFLEKCIQHWQDRTVSDVEEIINLAREAVADLT